MYVLMKTGLGRKAVYTNWVVKCVKNAMLLLLLLWNQILTKIYHIKEQNTLLTTEILPAYAANHKGAKF